MATLREAILPLRPDWLELDKPEPSRDAIDAVIEALESATTPADKVHARKVELGWVSPDGRELPWRFWQARAPNYAEYRRRGAA